MSVEIPVPEGDVTTRPLQFFWLTDYSGSMGGTKIATLNQAIHEALPEIRQAVANYPQVQIMMRAIKFSDVASWHIGPESVSLEQFTWPELGTAGLTATAQAIRLLASELTIEKMPGRGYPPVCVLVSDGYCTDPVEEYEDAIAELDHLPWGKKAIRLAIAIEDQAGDFDADELLKFVNHEVGVLKASGPKQLVAYIKWVSVAASMGASQSKSKGGAFDDTANVILPTPPDEVAIASSMDEF